jgi:N-acetyl-beta-hexosaminidase
LAKILIRLYISLLLNFSITGYLIAQIDNERLNQIIPTPKVVESRPGNFILNRNTTYRANSEAKNALIFLNSRLRCVYDFEINEDRNSDGSDIEFILESANGSGKTESYQIDISQKKIIIRAADEAGFFYSIQTLLQLFPDEIYGSSRAEEKNIQIPCAKIIDEPKYAWRSFMLDSGRQYQSIEFIKRYLDYLAMLKINVFHWHLTEGEGWRIEIKKYPKLTEIGSRVAKGVEQEGYYTQEEIREIVEYAGKLSIQVVPEIDVPGHSEAALTAYPELSCSKLPPQSIMEYTSNLFCGGNEATYIFLQNVLDEVCDLFPGKYIHLGGDEAPKDVWDTCSVCQNKIKEEGLKNSHELQIYFSSRLARYLQPRGKKVIFWGDIIEQEGQKLPDNVIIYWWNYRKKKDLAFQNAIKNNYKVICGSNYYTYLNFPIEPWSRYKEDRIFDIKDIYERNPSDIENPPEQVLGMGTCMWTDWNVKMSMIDQRVFPRILALAEQMWTKSKKIPFDKFYDKIKKIYSRLEIMKIEYGPALRSEVPLNYRWE